MVVWMMGPVETRTLDIFLYFFIIILLVYYCVFWGQLLFASLLLLLCHVLFVGVLWGGVKVLKNLTLDVQGAICR